MWRFRFTKCRSNNNKISKNSDFTKASGIAQISAKFLKDGTAVIASHLAKIINLP